MGADHHTFADVAGARALLLLADSSAAPSPPPPPPSLSDEFSHYLGSSSSSSSSSSYSGASVRSCVSDSTQRGRPVDPLRVLAVVASLRRVDPKVLAKATSTLFRSGAAKKRKGVWIEIDSDDEDRSERSSAVASEGSTVTAAASAGSTATSGRCRRPPRASGGDGGKPLRRADAIMQWLSRPQAVPATENNIRAAVGDNSGTSKAIRWLLKQEGGLRRAGTGGPSDPYVYMVAG